MFLQKLVTESGFRLRLSLIRIKIGFSALFVIALPVAVSAQALPNQAHLKGGDPIYVNGFEVPVSEACVPAYPNGYSDTWAGSFRSAWPSYNGVLILYPPFDGAFSLAFVAPAVSGHYGTIITADFPGDGEGVAQLSISSTPGCFDTAQLSPNCVSTVERTPELDWSHSGIPGRCLLTPGQTYYVNLTFGGVPSPGMPGCPWGGCATELRNVRR